MLSVDLVGSQMVVWETPGQPYVPGDLAAIQWQITNLGWDTALSGFSVDFCLSRDANISIGDCYLMSRWLAPGFPGLYAIASVSDWVALPPASNPIWNGSGSYYLGMIVDPFNEVWESNESNNSNVAFGYDVAVLNVSATEAGPDLAGSSLTLSTSSPVPGGQVQAAFSVSNLGEATSTPFAVRFCLSRDATIDASDSSVGTAQVTLSGNSYSSTATLNLPGRSDPIWNGTGTYYIGMVVDSGNAVAESSETNNSNRGLGLDVVSTTINVANQFSLTDLPPTNLPPGEVLSEFYLQLKKAYDATVKEYKPFRNTAKPFVDVQPFINSLSKISSDIGSLRSLIDSVRAGRGKTLKLGADTVLDRSTLELVDRFLIDVLEQLVPASASAAVSAAGSSDKPFGGAAAPADSKYRGPMEYLFNPDGSPAKWSDFKRIVGEECDKLVDDTKKAVADGFAAIGEKLGIKNSADREVPKAVSSGDKASLEKSQQALNELRQNQELNARIDKTRQWLGKTGDKCLKVDNDCDASDTLENLAFDVLNLNFQAICNIDCNLYILGSWKGSWEYQGHTGAVATFSLVKRNQGKSIDATVKWDYYNTDWTRRLGWTTGKITGASFDGPSTFKGTIEITPPGGARQSFSFTWDFSGGLLSGGLYVGSPIHITLRKNR